MKKRAQGSLEYLIIIAAVLAVAAIVVLFLTGAFGSSGAAAGVAKCKEAAARCATEWATSVNPLCSYCDVDCPAELVGKCKAGAALNITALECKNNVDCNDKNECTVDSCSGGYCLNAEVVNGTYCNSGNGSCQGGACVLFECVNDLGCDDGNECTADSCNVSHSCVHSEGSCDLVVSNGCCPSGCNIFSDKDCFNGELLTNGDFSSGPANWTLYGSHGNCPNVLSTDMTTKGMALLQGGNCYNDSGICLGSNQNYEYIKQIVNVSFLDVNQKGRLIFNFSSFINGSDYGYGCLGTYGNCAVRSCYRNHVQLEYLDSSNTVIGNTYFYYNNYVNLTQGDPNLCGVNSDRWFNVTADSWQKSSYKINDTKPAGLILNDVKKISVKATGYKVAAGPCAYPYAPYENYGSASRLHVDNLSLYSP